MSHSRVRLTSCWTLPEAVCILSCLHPERLQKRTLPEALYESLPQLVRCRILARDRIEYSTSAASRDSRQLR